MIWRKPAGLPARSTTRMELRILRRGAALAMLVGGALLMWLSPETLSGAVVMAAGIVLEAVGIGLDRRA